MYDTANNILNRTAVEVGLNPLSDPFASTDPAYRQLRYLLDAVGRELLRMYQWKDLTKKHTITTPSSGADGVFDLPDDFEYMIPQTSWNSTDQIPLFGPVSSQEWSFLEGRNLNSSTVYVSFRLQNRKFRIYPNNPDPSGKSLFFEYISNYWVETGVDTYASTLQDGGNTILFPDLLCIKFLKVKFLEAKGFDSTKARDDLNIVLDATEGQDKSAVILNAGAPSVGVPYLDGWRNVADSGYGG